MQRFFNMSFDITAVAFDCNGSAVPKRLDCAGRSFTLQPATNGGKYGFMHNGRYYWIERRGKAWQWATH